MNVHVHTCKRIYSISVPDVIRPKYIIGTGSGCGMGCGIMLARLFRIESRAPLSENFIYSKKQSGLFYAPTVIS